MATDRRSSAHQLQVFTDAVARCCAEAGPDVVLVAAVDDGAGSVLVATVPDPACAEAQQVFVGRHDFGALATRVDWSPTPDAPAAPAWALVTVGRGFPATFLVKRDAADRHWWSLAPTAAPWFLLSTASGVRAALDGEPLMLRTLEDERLLLRPDQVAAPVRPDGLL